MRKIYQKILFNAGKCVKSNNKLLNAYAKLLVLILSTIFHIQHYNYDELVTEVDTFNPNASAEERKRIIKETKKAYFKYRCSPREYFIFDLKHKTKKQIKEYLFDIEKIVLITFINRQADLKLLNAKEKTYQKLKQYYKRDMVFMKSKETLDYETFNAFVEQHNEFIAKPSNLSCGRGIEVFKLKAEEINDEKIKAIYDSLCESTPVIIEEFMHNAESIDAYYDQALNILRAVVFKTKENEIKIADCYFSFGSDGKEYTNNCVGSIAVPLDPKTGKAINNGFTFAYSVDEYEKHPDTCLVFKDLQLEKWDELLDLVHNLSNELPNVKYIGWDFALTPKGWVIVEGNGNAGQTIYQIIGKKSNRNHFIENYNLT